MRLLKQYRGFYFSHEGRLNRKNFFLCSIELWAFFELFYCPFFLIELLTNNTNPLLFDGILFVLSLLFCIGMTSISIKRLHDLNLSGRWVVLPLSFAAGFLIITGLFRGQIESEQLEFLLLIFIFLYICSSIILFILTCIILFFVKGTNGDNKYGLDLLQVEDLNMPRLPRVMNIFLVLFMCVYIPFSWFIESQKPEVKKMEEDIKMLMKPMKQYTKPEPKEKKDIKNIK